MWLLMALASQSPLARADSLPNLSGVEKQWAADEVQMEDLRSRHEFENTLIDKVAIAIIFTILGFSLNKALERYKLRAAQQAEWTTKRIEASNCVWKAMDALQGRITELQRVPPANARFFEETSRLRQQIATIEGKANEIKVLLDENRFLLGRVAYTRCCTYRQLLGALLRATVVADLENVRRIRRSLERRRTDLDAHIAGLGSEHPAPSAHG